MAFVEAIHHYTVCFLGRNGQVQRQTIPLLSDTTIEGRPRKLRTLLQALEIFVQRVKAAPAAVQVDFAMHQARPRSYEAGFEEAGTMNENAWT
jgi:hypothetical protein